MVERQTAPERGGSRLSRLLSADSASGFTQVTEARTFEFPADHGPHMGYRNEWWYFTGNLDGNDGEQFGYELTLFRFGLGGDEPTGEQSRWRSNQLYIGHFAVSDIQNNQFHVAQRYSRGSLGLAGAQQTPLRVWVEDWSIQVPGEAEKGSAGALAGEIWELRASEGDLVLQLQLRALKTPVLNGINGLSQKSSKNGNASYYYSISRLQTEGTLAVDGVEYQVSGLSWLDREWSSSGLAATQIGWDWFALQFDDDSELMFYDLRNLDGSRDKHSAGSLVKANGERIGLTADTVTIEVLDYWNSPRGDRYPSAWRLSSQRNDFELEVRPLMSDQELLTTVQYWEGAVAVTGYRQGKAISGRGYVELTGYADSDINK